MMLNSIFIGTDVECCVMNGIQALGKYSNLISASDNNKFQYSVDIDACLVNKYPNDNRWDYAFVYDNKRFYAEVHHASDTEVRVVIRKLNWLKDWQNRQINPEILKNNSKYYWISTGSVSITKSSRYSRMLSQAGLNFPQKMLRV